MAGRDKLWCLSRMELFRALDREAMELEGRRLRLRDTERPAAIH